MEKPNDALLSGRIDHEGLDALISAHAAQLGEFFDSVVILGVVQGDDEQEAQFSGGAGLYAARVRMCQEFVLIDNTRIRVRTAREDAADERQEQEGGEMEGAQ